jgi:hypothetical protein
MLNVPLDHGVVLGWIEMVGGKFRRTMVSVADEFNSLAKEFIVLRRFHSFYILIDPKVLKQHMWCGGTCNLSGVVVFGNENDHEKEDF